MKKAVYVLLLAALCSCAGSPDVLRYEAEKASHALAKTCADGWFLGKPFVEQDAAMVYRSLADWQSRLDADAQLLGIIK